MSATDAIDVVIARQRHLAPDRPSRAGAPPRSAAALRRPRAAVPSAARRRAAAPSSVAPARLRAPTVAVVEEAATVDVEGGRFATVRSDRHRAPEVHQQSGRSAGPTVGRSRSPLRSSRLLPALHISRPSPACVTSDDTKDAWRFRASVARARTGAASLRVCGPRATPTCRGISHKRRYWRRWRRRRAFAGRSSLRTWVVGILSHKVIDHFRRRTLQPSGDDPDLLIGAVGRGRRARGGGAAGAVGGRAGAARAARARAHGAADGATSKGVDREDCCNALGVSATHLRVLLHRGRNRLRRMLEHDR